MSKKNKKKEQPHKQIHIKLDEIEAYVDEEIADLIFNLWKLDIATLMSC